MLWRHRSRLESAATNIVGVRPAAASDLAGSSRLVYKGGRRRAATRGAAQHRGLRVSTAAGSPFSGAGSGSGASEAQPEKRPGGWLEFLKRKLQKRGVGEAGLAALLAYGLLDGLSKTAMFAVAFLGYEAGTGLNPAQNVAGLAGPYALMWAGSSLTRPLRLAGAAALAPLMNKVLDSLQKRLRLGSRLQAFLLVAAMMAGLCLSAVGVLIVSRWVKA